MTLQVNGNKFAFWCPSRIEVQHQLNTFYLKLSQTVDHISDVETIALCHVISIVSIIDRCSCLLFEPSVFMLIVLHFVRIFSCIRFSMI